MPKTQTKPGEFPRLFAFRTSDEHAKLLDLCVASFPGQKPGAALREFFRLPDVIDVITRRAEAEAARQIAAAVGARSSPGDAPPD